MDNKSRRFIRNTAKLIRQTRMAKGWSQEDLAWFTQLSQTSICTIELAKGDIKFSNIISIFTALNIKFSQLDEFQ